MSHVTTAVDLLLATLYNRLEELKEKMDIMSEHKETLNRKMKN